MKNNIRLVLATVAVALLTACGGGGGSGSGGGVSNSGGSNDANSSQQIVFGAIAIRVGGLESGVVGGQISQADANTLALNRCGLNCEIKEVFVGNKCGATAYSAGAGIMAWAIGDTQAAANNQAMLTCANGGGSFCTVYHGDCNVSTQISTTSGGVCFGGGTTFNCQGRVCTTLGDGVICSDGQFCPIPQNLSVTSNPVCAKRS